MGTCDPNLPCEKCGRTWEDVERNRMSHDNESDKLRAAIERGARQAISAVRRDFNNMVRPSTKRLKLSTFRTIGEFCRSRGLTKQEGGE